MNLKGIFSSKKMANSVEADQTAVYIICQFASVPVLGLKRVTIWIFLCYCRPSGGGRLSYVRFK